MPRRNRRKKTTTTVVVKRSQRGARPKRQRRRRQAYTQRLGGVGPMTNMIAKSLVDPWNCSACIPDGATGIGCFSVKQTFQLGTGSTGSCAALVWNLSPVNQYKSDSLSTAATPTLSGNYSSASAYASILALYSQFRAVSGGMKITYTSNTLTDQGILLVGQVATGIPPSIFNGAPLASAQALMQNYKVLPLRAGARFCWRPECCDDMLDYEPMGTVGPISAAPPYPYLLAIIYGANTNTGGLVVVDCIANYEGQYASQTFMPGGVDAAKQPPAEVGWYEKARTLIRSVDPILPMVGNAIGSYFGSGEAGSFAGTAAKYLLGTIDKPGLPRNNLKTLEYMTLD